MTRLVELIHSQGGRAILSTATPWPPAQAPTSVEEGYQEINNIRARASGLPLFEYDLAMSDGGSPARLIPVYNDSGDQTHPGDTGHAAAAVVAAQVMRQVFLA